MIRVLVDADACPVKNIIVRECKKRKIDVIMFIDTSHQLSDGYSKVITVDKGPDSVDIKLVNEIASGDIVVTQDFGVAAMTLSKKGVALNQNGMEYTTHNIDGLLFERHMGQKIRRGGGRTKGNKKRDNGMNQSFEDSFIRILDRT